MRKPIQIAIPTPCHEKWDKMVPVDKGRFCAACQKNVVDFTKAFDREIAEAFKKNGTLCGKFRNDQLERDLVIPNEKNSLWAAASATVIAFLMLGNNEAFAQEVKTEQTDSKSDNSILNKNLQPFIIKGRIQDSQGFMPGVDVENIISKEAVISDIDGKFSITAKEGDTIVFKFLGYETQTIIASHKNQNIIIEIDVASDFDMNTIGGATLSKGHSFFGRIFHSIGNLFR